MSDGRSRTVPPEPTERRRADERQTAGSMESKAVANERDHESEHGVGDEMPPQKPGALRVLQQQAVDVTVEERRSRTDRRHHQGDAASHSLIEEMNENKADGEASSSWKQESGPTAETAGTSQPAAEKVEKTPLTFEVNEKLATAAFAHLQAMQQASKAIDHCETAECLTGTRMHVEAEKILLVATQARLAALNEMQRLRGGEETPSDGRQRSLVVSKVILPIIEEALELPSGLVHYFLLLFEHNGSVQATPLVSSDDLTSRNGGICLDFKVDDIHFSPVQENFNVKVDIFSLKSMRRGVAKRKNYPMKKAKTKIKGAHSGKKAGCSSREPPESVPGGPSSVRLSSFRHLGFFPLDGSTCGGCVVPVTMMPGCCCLEDSAFVQSELLPC